MNDNNISDEYLNERINNGIAKRITQYKQILNARDSQIKPLAQLI